MKILYMHNRDVRIESGVGGRNEHHKEKEKRRLEKKYPKVLPTLDEKNKIVSSKDAIMAFVCVEKGDEGVDLQKVKEHLLRTKATMGAVEILMGGFAHLSNNLAEPQVAREMIDRLAVMVQIEVPATQIWPFGWDKGMDFHLPLHSNNVTFGEYLPIPDQKEFWNKHAEAFHRYMEETGHYSAQVKILKQLRHLDFSSVLEIACGTGCGMLYFLNNRKKIFGSNYRYLGIDSSREMLAIGRRIWAGSMLFPHFEHVEVGKDSLKSFLAQRRDVPTLISAANLASYIDPAKLLEEIKEVYAYLDVDKHVFRVLLMEEDPFIPGFSATQTPGAREQLTHIRSHLSIAELKKIAEEKGFVLEEEVRAPIDGRHDLVGMVFKIKNI